MPPPSLPPAVKSCVGKAYHSHWDLFILLVLPEALSKPPKMSKKAHKVAEMLLIYFSFPVILKDSPSEASSKCLRLSGCWHLWAGDPLLGWQVGQNWNNLHILPISGRFLFQTTTVPCFPKLSKNPFLCAQNKEKKSFCIDCTEITSFLHTQPKAPRSQQESFIWFRLALNQPQNYVMPAHLS